MRADGHEFAAMLDKALYYREVCLEWAASATAPASAAKMRQLAEEWEAFVSTLQRDAEIIASSLRLIGEANKLVQTALIGRAFEDAPAIFSRRSRA